jgi:hypothetical protein
MADAQLYLAIGVPFLAILISTTLSLMQISGIRDDMRGLHTEMQSLRTDTREIINTLGADLKLLTGKVIEIDNRLTRIEERLEHR